MSDLHKNIAWQWLWPCDNKAHHFLHLVLPIKTGRLIWMSRCSDCRSYRSHWSSSICLCQARRRLCGLHGGVISASEYGKNAFLGPSLAETCVQQCTSQSIVLNIPCWQPTGVWVHACVSVLQDASIWLGDTQHRVDCPVKHVQVTQACPTPSTSHPELLSKCAGSGCISHAYKRLAGPRRCRSRLAVWRPGHS